MGLSSRFVTLNHLIHNYFLPAYRLKYDDNNLNFFVYRSELSFAIEFEAVTNDGDVYREATTQVEIPYIYFADLSKLIDITKEALDKLTYELYCIVDMDFPG